MIRVLSFLAAIAALTALLIFVADRPGEVALALEHWHVQTSLAVALAALMALAAMAVGMWIVLRNVWLAPVRAAAEARERRKARGLKALSHGLLAVGAGDLRAARRNAVAAQKLVPGEPLALLLAAQTAQLAGDTASAEDNFRKMAAREETKLLGLRGLFIEARRRDDPQAARVFAEEAARAVPTLEWAGQAVLQLRCAAGDWEGALQAVEEARKAGTLDKATYRRHRAALLAAQALAEEQRDRDRSKALVLEAVKLAPDLVPA
ncbi:MAG: heme biosynthesis HemY N-terminal domain-containing protein, partial [Pseudorhodoplanes sp.]